MTNNNNDPYTPHIRFHEADQHPNNAPRIRLSMSAPLRLSITIPYQMSFTLSRDADDGDPRTCMVLFDPALDVFIPSNLILLRHRPRRVTGDDVLADGAGYGDDSVVELDKVDIEPDPEAEHYAARRKAIGRVFGGWDCGWCELPPGGRRIFGACRLPARYNKALVAGERYELLCAGADGIMWTWGSQRENREKKLAEDELPRLVIPGGSRLGFVAEREAVPWPQREEYEARMGFADANEAEWEWRVRQAWKERHAFDVQVKPSERVPGTPKLVVTLDCPPTLTLHSSHPGSTFEVQIVVTYDAPACERPITFHTYDLNPYMLSARSEREGYALYRHCGLSEPGGEQEWEIYVDEEADCGAYAVFDAPDIKVSVRQDDDFVSLRPGESWTTTYTLQSLSWSQLGDDVRDGDVFRYQFKGTAGVDWWDWGHIENEHVETLVTLPCWRGRVVDPADNGGRPKLVVPAAKPVEFRIIG